MNVTHWVIIRDEQGKYGLQTAEGREIEPCLWDRIADYDDDGYIRMYRGKNIRTINVHGREMIALSQGLTWLGVFYRGHARARTGSRWGLVDPHGNPIEGFPYRSIEPRGRWGYEAVRFGGVWGFLHDNGTFEPHTEPHPPLHEKPLYRQGNPQLNVQYFVETLTKWYAQNGPLKLYYRDTDTEVDTSKLRIGLPLRAGRWLEATPKLRRPVHRTRYLIMSPGLIDIEKFKEQNPDLANQVPYRGWVIHPFQCFVVVSVYSTHGIQQIALLEMPWCAASLIHRYPLAESDLYHIKALNGDGEDFADLPWLDLDEKINDLVAGPSVSSYWQKAMAAPLGLNADGSLCTFGHPDKRGYDPVHQRLLEFWRQHIHPIKPYWHPHLMV